MKLIFLTLFVVIFLMDASTKAQRPRCTNPSAPNCTLPMNVGTNCTTPPPRRTLRRWYFDINSRSCRRLAYLGCGGNDNRFCSIRDCRRTCGRGRP